VLNLVLARGYLTKLFGNARVARYLSQRYSDIFQELQTVKQQFFESVQFATVRG